MGMRKLRNDYKSQNNFVGYHIQHPELKDKPDINEVSRLLVQGKRSNEPVHERLFKQDLMAKKIAQEAEQNERPRSRANRPDSRQKSRPQSAV